MVPQLAPQPSVVAGSSATRAERVAEPLRLPQGGPVRQWGPGRGPIPRRSNTQDASKARQEDLWEMFTANFEAMQISDLPSAGDHRMLNAPSWW